MSGTLAERLVEFREGLGLTQAEAARRLAMKQPQLSKLETGVNVPGTEVLARIAEAYGTTVGRLIGGDSTQAMEGSASSPDGVVTVSRETLAYWRGRFDTMADWAHALDTMMQQTREQFARFTQGVNDFRESGVIPRPMTAEQLTRDIADAKARGESYRERERTKPSGESEATTPARRPAEGAA